MNKTKDIHSVIAYLVSFISTVFLLLLASSFYLIKFDSKDFGDFAYAYLFTITFYSLLTHFLLTLILAIIYKVKLRRIKLLIWSCLLSFSPVIVFSYID